MARLAAIFIAFFVVTASAAVDVAAAASAEDAIKGWIAQIPPSSDWKVTYGNIAYDMATDRTTVSGLKLTSAKAQLTATFDTLVINGFNATADGGFNAASITTDGKFVGPEAQFNVSGIAINNFSTPSWAPITYDPDKPFASITAIYSQLAKVNLGHAGIAAVSFTSAPDAGNTHLTYSNFAVDNWASGKIASMTSGPINATYLDDNGDPGSFAIGGFEAKDTDLAAVARIYDPKAYANGVGDMVWHPALASAAYHDLTIDSPDFSMTMGSWTLDNVRVRQPQHSFTDALDAAAAAGNHDRDPGPGATRAFLDLWSAFSIGKFGVNDVKVDSGSGSGSLGAFTLADFSSDGLGEISVDNLNIDMQSDGFAKIGRLAAGNMVFPGVDKIAAAIDAAENDQEPDFGSLSATLGHVEAASIDVQTPDTPEMTLDKARLDLGNYVGVIPTNIALSITGFEAPAELFSEDGTDVQLRALDYDRIRADYGVKIAWDEAKQTITIDGLNVALADVGSVSGKAVFSGLSRDDLTNFDTLPDALQNLNLVSSSVTFQDSSLFSRWIASQAYMIGISQSDYRKQLLAMLPDALSDLSDGAFKTKLTNALTTFIQRPGSITLSAMPKDPTPASGLVFFATLFPEALPDALNLDVSATAGPVPTDFDYVPPPAPDFGPQTPTDDYRHVPFKKY